MEKEQQKINAPIIAICGKSCVGKTTIEKRLALRNGFVNIVSLTTRPKRINEVDGVDYKYVSEDEFNQIREANGFYEETSYDVNGKIFKYAYPKGCFKDNKVNILVVNLRGLNDLMQYPEVRDRLVVIMLESSPNDIMNRYFAREGNGKDVMARFNARVKEDMVDFSEKKLGFLKWFSARDRIYWLSNEGMDGLGLGKVESEILGIVERYRRKEE